MKLPFPDIEILVLDTILNEVYDNPITRKDYLTFIDMFERRLSRNIDDNFSVEMNAENERIRWGTFTYKGKKVRKFTEIVNTLKNKNIITSTGYLPGEHSKRYYYTEAFTNAITKSSVNIIEEEINDKLYETLKNSKIYDEDNLQHGLLASPRFSIDLNKCIEFITTSYTVLSKHAIITNLKRIVDINNKIIFSVRINNGRVYTSFSSMKKELRNLCMIDNVFLESIDLKSSQYYFLFSYLKNKYPHSSQVRELYEIITNQDIYEWIMNVNNEIDTKKIKSRNDCKTPAFTYLFKLSNKGNDPIQRIFKLKFPEVYEIIKKERQYFINKGTNLANYLQGIEADIFIPICEKYCEQGCLSVHDSLYFKSELRGRIEIDLKEKFIKEGFNDFTLR